MDISNRLLSICSFISDSLVYDIGCDHALLDIYLTLYKNCCCVCYDVDEYIIDRAKKNICKHGLVGKIDCFVGNGFNDLNLDNNSVMVLSGMGTSTILKIFKNNKTNTIICQTNTEKYLLRKTICENGYYISDESIVFDNNRYYVTIKFCRGSSNYSYDELLLGPVLLKKNDSIFKDYLNNMYRKNIKAYNKSLEYNLDSDVIKVVDTLKKYI